MTFNELVKGCVGNGDMQKALEMVVSGWVHKGDMQEARQVAAQMREAGVEPNVLTLNNLLEDGQCRRAEAAAGGAPDNRGAHGTEPADV